MNLKKVNTNDRSEKKKIIKWTKEKKVSKENDKRKKIEIL